MTKTRQWKLTDTITGDVYFGKDRDDLEDTLRKIFDMDNPDIAATAQELCDAWARNEYWGADEAALAVALDPIRDDKLLEEAKDSLDTKVTEASEFLESSTGKLADDSVRADLTEKIATAQQLVDDDTVDDPDVYIDYLDGLSASVSHARAR